jgi:hypothetical protein
MEGDDTYEQYLDSLNDYVPTEYEVDDRARFICSSDICDTYGFYELIHSNGNQYIYHVLMYNVTDDVCYYMEDYTQIFDTMLTDDMFDQYIMYG